MKFLFFVSICSLIFHSCTKAKSTAQTVVAGAERQSASPIISSRAEQIIATTSGDPAQNFQDAKIGILYYLDNPNHRLTVKKALDGLAATVLYENETLGFISAKISWTSLSALLKTKGQLNLSDSSIFKIELDDIVTPEIPAARKSTALIHHKNSRTRKVASDDSLHGPTVQGAVHSAGYGAKLDEFRALIAKRFQVDASAVNGAGVSLAVFDGGFSAVRSPLLGNRLKDIIVSDNDSWHPATQSLNDVGAGSTLPAELASVPEAANLHFVEIENTVAADEAKKEAVPEKEDFLFAVAKASDGTLKTWIRTDSNRAFEGPYLDFSVARQSNATTVVDLFTGKPWVKGNAAGWIKLRERADKSIEIALAGAPGNTHGSGNMHMAVGDFSPYLGVASGSDVLLVQAWDADHYGQSWLPLAQGIAQAVDAKADVLDLDIFTPGYRFGNDLLSRLLCRVTSITNTVPVVAAHNFGPLPNSVQNLAQSPCVITVGASISKAAEQEGYGLTVLSPALTNPTDVFTASYSGRGPGYLGTFKPDIISPAYAYTVYADGFDRFGGTSGATPATSGAIALLKQVATLAKQTLNFSQVRFFLQAGSAPVAPDHFGDGYGYLDMNSTGTLLLKHLDAAAAAVPAVSSLPLQVSSPTRTLRYQKNPLDITSTLTLSRYDVDNPNAGTMIFSVQNGDGWLQLYQSGSKANSLEVALELPPNTTPIRAYLNLSDADWSAFPPGNHIALIKGVRKELAAAYGDRAADILIPVVLTKGISFTHDLTIKIPPLFLDTILPVTLDTTNRQALKLDGDLYCGDKRLRNPLSLVVRTKQTGEHPTEDINSYAPITFNGDPMSFPVSSNTSDLVLARVGSSNCSEGISGNLHISYPDVQYQTGDISIQSDNNGIAVSYNTSISSSDTLKVEFTGAKIAEQVSYTGKQKIALPKGVHELNVLNAKTLGVLEIYSAEDNSLLLRTNSGSSYLPGDETGDPREKNPVSLNQSIDELRNDDPNAALYAIFTPSDLSAAYKIELSFAVPSAWKVKNTVTSLSQLQVKVTYPSWDAVPIPKTDDTKVLFRATMEVSKASQDGTLSQKELVSQKAVEFPLAPVSAASAAPAPTPAPVIPAPVAH